MPEDNIGAVHKTKSGQLFYRHEDGWNTTPLTEEELAKHHIKKGQSLTGSFGSKAANEAVAAHRKTEWDDFKRTEAIGIAMDMAAPGLRHIVAPLIKYKVGRGVASLAGQLAAGTAVGSNIAASQGREDVSPFTEAVVDRAFDYGMRGVIKGAKNLGALKPSEIGNTAKSLFAKSAPLNDVQQATLRDLAQAQEFSQLPLPTGAAMSKVPESMIGQKARAELSNKILRGQGDVVDVLVPSRGVQNLNSPKEFTDKFTADYLTQKRADKNLERSKHENLDNLIEQTTVNVQVPQPSIPSSVVDATGNPIMIPQPPKNIVSTGPIDITDKVKWAAGLNEELLKIAKEGNLPDTTSRSLNSLQSMLGNLANTPQINGRYIADYRTVKAIRNSVSHLLSEFPPTDTRKRQLVGAAKNLISGLSEATEDSILNSSVYTPQTQLAYAEANALTKQNADKYNSKLGRTLESGQDFGSGKLGKEFDIDREQVIMNALKSRNGIENLRRMSGNSYDNELSSLYMKIGLDQAQDPKTGLFDATKLDNYFFNQNGSSASILQSDIFTPQQRRVVKDFTKYMQRVGTMAAPASVDQAMRNTAIKGGIYAATAITGAGLGLHQFGAGGVVGGALAAVIPITRKFIENVLMDPEGGRLVQKMIYSPTSKAQQTNRSKLVEFAIRNGVKVLVRKPDSGEEHEIN